MPAPIITIQLLRQGIFENEYLETVAVVPSKVLGFDGQCNAIMTDASGSGSGVGSAEILGSGADQSLTTSFADVTGLALAIPSAGVYLMTALVSILGIESGPGIHEYEKFQAKLRDTTNSVDIAGSLREVSVYSLEKGQIYISNKYTAPGACNIVVQAKVVTFGGKVVLTESSLAYIKL